MSSFRRAARVDDNLKAIVNVFRRLGCSVHVTNGAWDATVGYGGITILVEVKDGSKPASRRKLTPAQVKFRETWTGGIYLVQCEEDAVRCVETLRDRHKRLCVV